MASLLTNFDLFSTFFSTQLSNTELIKDDATDTGDTSQFIDWLVSALVCDIETAKEEAKVAKEEARVAKEEARVAKEEARTAKEEAKKLQTEIQNLTISLDFYKEIEMFLKDEKIHELEVCIKNLKYDVQKINVVK